MSKVIFFLSISFPFSFTKVCFLLLHFSWIQNQRLSKGLVSAKQKNLNDHDTNCVQLLPEVIFFLSISFPFSFTKVSFYLASFFFSKPKAFKGLVSAK